jgi:hypothetical protein
MHPRRVTYHMDVNGMALADHPTAGVQLAGFLTNTGIQFVRKMAASISFLLLYCSSPCDHPTI